MANKDFPGDFSEKGSDLVDGDFVFVNQVKSLVSRFWTYIQAKLLTVSLTAIGNDAPGNLFSYGTNTSGTKGFFRPALFESTGVLSGFATTINGGDNTKFDVAAGVAVFCDYSSNPAQPVRSVVSYAGATAIGVTGIGSAISTYVGINSSGTLVQQTTPWTDTQRRTIATIAILIHSNLVNLNAVNTQVGPVREGISQLFDYLDYRGPTSKGIIYSANGANLNINRTSGSIFKFGANFQTNPLDPHQVAISSGSAVTFRYRTQTGTETADTTNVLPSSYDLAGVVTAVPVNKFTVQRITLFQSGLQRIQYGQNIYNSMDEAIANFQNETFVLEQNISDNGIFRGWLVVKQGITVLNDTTTARFIPVLNAGSAGAPTIGLPQSGAADFGSALITTTGQSTAAAFNGSLTDLPNATHTVDGATDAYRCTRTSSTTAITLSVTNWPANATRRVFKDNASTFTITVAPPSGGTINGLGVDVVLTLPGSSEASATGRGDMFWDITRIGATNAFEVTAGGCVRFLDSGSAQVPGVFTASELRTSGDGTVSAPAIRVGTDADTGLYREATKGVVTTVNGVDRFTVRADSSTDVLSQTSGLFAAFVITTTTGSSRWFVHNVNPEGVITASIGAECIDTAAGRRYLKRTGSGNTGWVQIDRCESGTYTPTASALSNADSVTPGLAMWVRVGDVVTVEGTVTADPTAAASFFFELSLPVASNFGALSDLSGQATSEFGGTADAYIRANTATDLPTFNCYAAGTASSAMHYSFTYRVLP